MNGGQAGSETLGGGILGAVAAQPFSGPSGRGYSFTLLSTFIPSTFCLSMYVFHPFLYTLILVGSLQLLIT